MISLTSSHGTAYNSLRLWLLTPAGAVPTRGAAPLCPLPVPAANDPPAIPHTQRSGTPLKNVVPKSCSFPVCFSVLAVVDVSEGENLHEKLTLQQASLRILDDPEGWCKVPDDFDGFLDDLVRLNKIPDSDRFRNAVFRARG